MFKNILIVCVGNICRSPTAEALFLHRLGDQGLTIVGDEGTFGEGVWNLGVEDGGDGRGGLVVFGRGVVGSGFVFNNGRGVEQAGVEVEGIDVGSGLVFGGHVGFPVGHGGQPTSPEAAATMAAEVAARRKLARRVGSSAVARAVRPKAPRWR